MGPVISVLAANKMLDAQSDLSELGAKTLLLMIRLTQGKAWISPGILDVTSVENLPDKEYFGPLLQVIRYQTFEQAVEQANRTDYGLSAALLSENEKRFDYFYHHIKAGIVNWNRQTTGALGSMPFGGVGFSGNHRSSAWYAADYCAYPVSSIQSDRLLFPDKLLPGITI